MDGTHDRSDLYGQSLPQREMTDKGILGVVSLKAEHDEVLKHARDLVQRIAAHNMRACSDSLRLAVSLTQHIVELIEAADLRLDV